MGTPNKFKMYLKPTDTTYYQVSGGLVSTTSTATPIKYAPKDWENTELVWARNTDYKGIFRSLKTEYQFVLDGAQILRDVYYKEGVEGVCTLEIWIRKDYDWTYELFHSAGLNFKTFQDLQDFVNISLDDDSVLATLKANANVTYEIDNDSLDVEYLALDGITLEGLYSFAPQEAQDSFQRAFQLPHFFAFKEGDFSAGLESDQAYYDSFDIVGYTAVSSIWTDAMYNSTCYTYRANQDIDLTLEISDKIGLRRLISGAGDTTFNLSYLIVDQAKEVTEFGLLDTSPTLIDVASTYIEWNIDITSLTISLNAGDKLYIIVQVNTPAPAGDVRMEFFGNPDLSTVEPIYYIRLNESFRLSPTITKGLNYYKFFDKVCQAALEDSGSVSYSAFLRSKDADEDNVPFYTLVTCGDAIRQFDGTKIRTSFNDMFMDASKRWSLGLGLNSGNQLILEKLSTFYDKDTLCYDLGEVKDLELIVAEDLLFNSLSIGQDNETYDKLNGRSEYNQKTEFKLPFKRVVTAEDWVSPYRFDMYGIETYRANLSRKESVDSSSDNDTFVISCKDGFATYALRRPNYGSGGTISGTTDLVYSYNLDLTAKRQLLRNKDYLAAICYQRYGLSITFQTTDKNPNLQCKFDSTRPNIVENESIDVDDLVNPLFLPIYAEFESQVPVNIKSILETSPYGYFSFITKNGVTLKGFLEEVGFKPQTNAAYRWRLLLCPDNDLTQLIR